MFSHVSESEVLRPPGTVFFLALQRFAAGEENFLLLFFPEACTIPITEGHNFAQ
jgi:hypothetical protein